MDDDELLINNNDLYYKKPRYNIFNIIEKIISIISSIFIIIFFIIYFYNPQPHIEVSVTNVTHVGISMALLSGIIKSNQISKIQYYFEYGTVDWYDYNRTKLNIPDFNSNEVYNTINYLKPSSLYKYRLIANIGEKIYSVSDYSYFQTCDIPNLYLIHNETINNTTEYFSGILNNTCSYNLQYFGQIRLLGSSRYYNTEKIDILSSSKIQYISSNISYLSTDTWYNFRFAVQERYSDIIYTSNSSYFII